MTHPKKSKRRKPTITRAAQELGVTRVHLSFVIHGHRSSRSLSARYQAWLKQQDGTP